MTYSKDDLREMAKRDNVDYLRLQFSDMLGIIKCVEVPISKLDDVLNNRIMFDGSSIEGFVRIKEADMYLHPDLSTWLLLSFEDETYGKVARLICDVYTIDNQPFEGDPRYILKKQLLKMQEYGIARFQVGFEPEFYLFDECKQSPTALSDCGGYFDMAPIDGANECRRDISLTLENMGFQIESSHHEVGPGQQEITFRYMDALSACDSLQTYKQVVKTIAHRHHLKASFMPKPIFGLAGNGMHTNCSLWDEKNQNLFYNQDDRLGLSLLAKKWISGIIAHARSLCAITNPSINSYKRLVLGYEAPVHACWSDANRSAMIRIPASKGKATRSEIRNVDPLANPYLALACILASGLDGIQNNLPIIEPVYDNVFQLTREEREKKGILNLPENLKDALKELKQDSLLHNVLGDHTFEKYLLAKQTEWDEYRSIVTTWELQKYL